MSNGHVLEVATLDELHPRLALMMAVGVSTVVRLSLDPTPAPAGTMTRAVAVHWVGRLGGAVQEVSRVVGWNDLPAHVRDACGTWAATSNVNDITEEAAIGVMGLLLADLESAEIHTVLQIGSGGDYQLEVFGDPRLQVEVSGIHVDDSGRRAAGRRDAKRAQLLGKSDAGFVSVTTFRHGVGGGVHSYVHYVVAPPRSAGQNGSGGKPKGKKGRRK